MAAEPLPAEPPAVADAERWAVRLGVTVALLPGFAVREAVADGLTLPVGAPAEGDVPGAVPSAATGAAATVAAPLPPPPEATAPAIAAPPPMTTTAADMAT